MSPSEPSASGPAGRRRKNSESDEVSAGPSSRTGGRRRAGGRRKQETKGRRRPLLVVAGVAVVALAVLGTVLYMRLGEGDGADQAAQETRPVMYRVIDTGRMNEVLASREGDSRALNAGELFESRNAEISSQEIDFTLRDSDLSEDCSAAVWGEQVRTALAEADCTQAGRATYVSDTYFGVTAVFNLADVEGSRAVAAAMNAPEADEAGADEEGDASPDSGFVLSPSGADPFDRLGEGYSASDAIVSGHYLVVVWVQPTNSESVEERVSLSGPLVALANFRDPLYRRMVQLDDGSETGQTDEGTQEGTVEDPAGTEGTVQDPAGTDGTVQDPAGTQGTAEDPAGTDGLGTGTG
ncbi:hypothetical protein [Nocardiopsis tropica]|uniref:Uncharacterized protein n=1 Tax=Nocardiopsis tropica TaxID=109330 RepID=A0ABU7KSS0_9ACTN|nr:hypothetical protein [Nocardiopsis umidischolae]MEE2052351.1 hypothetical protein [Nocardiopsis umidischolae]